MKNNNLKLTVTLSLMALAGFASSASADVITINFDDPLPGDFVWDDTRIVNGNCSDSSCMAFNDNETSTLSRTSDGTFTLESFWFKLLGNGTGNTLKVTSGGTDYEFGRADWDKNTGYVVTNLVNFMLTDVTSITFSKSSGGNVRVDDLVVSFVGGGDGDGDPVKVPEPGTLGLLGLGLLGLGLKGRRKA